MAFTAATWGLLIHILAALWLASGAFASAVVRAQVKRAGELRERGAVMRVGQRLSQVFGIPGAIVVGLSGFYLVTARGFTFSTPWVMASIIVYALAMVNFFVIILPRLRAMGLATEASIAAGKPSEEMQRLAGSMKLIGILADVNLLLIVLLVALMVLKPGAAPVVG